MEKTKSKEIVKEKDTVFVFCILSFENSDNAVQRKCCQCTEPTIALGQRPRSEIHIKTTDKHTEMI